MKILKIYFVILISFVCFAYPAYGEAESLFDGGAGARPIGLGGAFTAVADSPDALFYNPSGISNLKKISFTSTYAKMFYEVNYLYAAAVYPLHNCGAIGLGILRSGVDGIIQQDGSGNQLGTFGYLGQAVYLSYAFKLNEKVSLGLNTDFISQNMLSSSHSTIGIDFGALYQLNNKVSLGLDIQNINQPKLGPDTINRNLKIGMSLRPHQNILVAAQVDMKSNRNAKLRAGGEWNILPQFGLRIGYDSSKYYLGTTLSLGSFSLDYSFNPHELGDVSRVSISLM